MIEISIRQLDDDATETTLVRSLEGRWKLARYGANRDNTIDLTDLIRVAMAINLELENINVR